MVVIMLGTNDLKRRFSLGPSDIAAGACRLARLVEVSEAGPVGGAPAVLLVAPPPILETGDFSSMFTGGAATSAGLAAEFRRLAAERGIPVLAAEDFLASSPLDGIHLSREGQRALGEAVAERIALLLP
jgi:lysophospholipase L1-like esterase